MLFIESYNDSNFNECILSILKERLRKRSLFFRDSYKFESREYKVSDIIDSLYCFQNKSYNVSYICFKENRIVKHLVYDLNQRFWLEEMQEVLESIGKFYLRYKSYGKLTS